MLWRAWEPITGCRIGISGKKKTVLTGVRWSATGRAEAPPDLELRTVEGELVPFMPPWEAYKHLGMWRRADGAEDVAWKQLLRKFDAALGGPWGAKKGPTGTQKEPKLSQTVPDWSPEGVQNDTQMAHEMNIPRPRRRPETLRRP